MGRDSKQVKRSLGEPGRTDFERHGLVGQKLSTAERAWLLTVDVEAFSAESIHNWLMAMRRWSALCAQGKWRFAFFIALEDLVRLHAEDRDSYDAFVRAAKDLHDAGTHFYPHNHGVFDLRTGAVAPDRPQRVQGYGRRASFAYDVVYRHGKDLGDWMRCLVDQYDNFLNHAGIPRPERLAFRAGGWDHGDTAEMSRSFVDALERNSFAFDSSAFSGTFGTKSWNAGTAFGSNVFSLSPEVVEVAPCWSLNCAAGWTSRETLGAIARLVRQPLAARSRTAPGAFVTVLHFDHLFRGVASRDASGGAAPPAVVEKRISSFFRLLDILRAGLNFTSMTFEELTIHS
jgi:hypothetical protein